MKGPMRRRTTCAVPGHGTQCGPAREKDNDYGRAAEKHLAMLYEARANAQANPSDPMEWVRNLVYDVLGGRGSRDRNDRVKGHEELPDS